MATKSDVNHILDIKPQQGVVKGNSVKDQNQALKEKQKKPGKCMLNFQIAKPTPNFVEKVNREVYALVGGIPQVTPSEKASDILKKEKIMKKKCDPWIWTPFTNQGRTDGYKFNHWTKKKETSENYYFAKFNKKIDLPVKYSSEEYENLLKDLDKDWTKEETDHLWRLCERFDLRFVVIADRFSEPIDLEEEQQKSAKKRETKALKKKQDKENFRFPERSID